MVREALSTAQRGLVGSVADDVRGSLDGVSVVVAGAGLAGLAAARDLIAMGAQVTVVDARDRIGGRVFTVRDGFKERQHAEAGGDIVHRGQGESRGPARRPRRTR